MKSPFSSYKAAMVGFIAFVVLQPPVWSDDSLNVRISSPLPASNQRTSSTLLFPVTEEDKSGKETGIRKFDVAKNATRLLSFSSAVLSVSFSGPKIIEASAVNARTVAITGTGIGTTDLVITVPRHVGDTVGQPVAFAVEVVEPSILRSSRATLAASRVLVPVDTSRVSQLLGRKWPDGNKTFEQMLAEEIQRRDKRIKELEKQLREKKQ